MMNKLLRFLYQTGLLVFGVLYLPHLFVRLRQVSDKWEFLRERFGFFPNHLGEGNCLWIQAVSVGEVTAARELVCLFVAAHPAWKTVISVTTPMGYRVAKKIESDRVRVVYFPFDFSGSMKRSLAAFQPKCVILMETEIWPNLIHHAEKAGIPIGIMNGRISDRSFPRYRLVQPLLAGSLAKLSFCFAREPVDSARFQSLGIPENRVRVTGNMKYDAETSCDVVELEMFRKKWGLGRAQVLVAGSTHAGEEEIIVRAFKQLRPSFPDLRLVLVPRHLERAQEAARTVSQNGLAYSFSALGSGNVKDVLIVDEVGKLCLFYGISSLIFVGGSLVRRGGQNPIEAARERKPILHGPHVSNFREVFGRLDRAEAALTVTDRETFLHAARVLLSDRVRAQAMGEQAFRVVNELKGATRRNLAALEPWLIGAARNLNQSKELV